MPARRSNRVAAAAADAVEWAMLVENAASRPDTHHHVKAVCLASVPSRSTKVKFFLFSKTGHPLGTTKLIMEDSLENVLVPYAMDTMLHPIFEIIFEEKTDATDDDVVGVVLGIKDPSQAVTTANLNDLLELYEGQLFWA